MRTMVFDLDGTLADTSADLIAAANACFRGLGHGDLLVPQADALTAFHGGRAMLRLGFARLGGGWTEAMVDAQYPVLLAAYAEVIDRETRLYPGAMAAVARLRAAGWRTGICTNKPSAMTEIVLDALDLSRHFAAMVGGDFPRRKPDGEHIRETLRRMGAEGCRALYVGDSITDVKAARDAGLPVVAVDWGYARMPVAQLGADRLISHFAALPAVIRDLLP